MSTPASDTPAVGTPPPTATPAPAGTPAAAPPVPAPPVPAPAVPAPQDGPDDITITSTTDTIEQVQAALEHKVPDAQAKAPAPAPTEAKPDSKASPAGTPTPEPTPTDAAKTLNKQKKSLQDRIDEVTFQREEARRAHEAQAAENARLRAENDALKSGKTPPAAPGAAAPAAAKPATPPKPELKDFNDEPDPYAAWTEALTDWKADRAAEKVRAEMDGKLTDAQKATADARAAEAAALSDQQAMQVFGQRSLAYRAQVGAEKYDQEIAQIKAQLADGTREEQVYPPRLLLHVTRSEMGPALIHHFAQHDDSFREIAAMHDTAPSLMLVALGKLEAKLETTYSPAQAGKAAPVTPSTPAARAIDALASSSIPAAPVSTAPAPPTLVGGSPTATNVPLEELPYQDFKAMRNASDRARRR